MKAAFVLSAWGLMLVAPAFGQDARTGKSPDAKPYLETPAGMTLYVFDGDGPSGGGSSCYDQCAKLWPPFAADPAAKPHGPWTIVKRTDGSMQWAYRGRPLYAFGKDLAPGQENGNAFNGNKWHVAEP